MMIEMAKSWVRCAVIPALVLGLVSGVANAQDGDAEEFRHVQLLFYLVQADGFTEQDPEISDIVTELNKLFNFKGYRLLSTSVQNIVLEDRTGLNRLGGHGIQRIVAGDSEVPWALSVNVTARPSSPTIRVEVSLTSVVGRELVERYLEASVTMRDGQKVVLGSTRPSAEEPTLILVVTPKFDPGGPTCCETRR